MADALAINGGKKTIKEPLPSIKDASGRYVGEEEMELLREVIDSGCLSFLYGTKVREFERGFAKLHGVPNTVAVSSGTAALHTAVTYINPAPGDEIILSPITDMGTAIPIMYQNAVPVFADVDRRTYNVSADQIESKITDRTRAIIVTHIFGGPCDMDPILEVAKKHNLAVIEDCAQAHLARYKGRIVGTIGDLGCFSFQQSKHITTGDGGMVISREDEKFGRRLRLCADKGWPRSRPGRDHLFLANNFHMTELQAAVGLAQIAKYPAIIKNRVEMAQYLNKLLAGVDGITPAYVPTESEHTYFYYVFELDAERIPVSNIEFSKMLIAEGLLSEPGYPGPIPLYLYDVIKKPSTYGDSGCPFDCPLAARKYVYAEGLCPVAEEVCRRTIILPWTEKLTRRHVELIAKAIKKVAANIY